MSTRDDITWFKDKFSSKVEDALVGTPLTLDLLCAIALQETGYIWRRLRAKGLSTRDILRLCVGDTLDAPSRSAFPKNKAALVAKENGRTMFDLAHSLLVEMGQATGLADYIRAGRNPNKFCHGYGIFQRDLQFFKNDPDYFLSERWAEFDRCLAEAVEELKRGLRSLGYTSKPQLTDRQLCYVAIVYNTGFGNFDEHRGLKQGFKDSNGIYYGEHIERFLELSKEVPTPPIATAGSEIDGTTETILTLAATTNRSVVEIARSELAIYGGIYEGNDPLSSHIDDYWRAAGADPNDYDPTNDPWSAAFISYCVRKSGATEQQFHFNVRHSEFVYAAIRDADNDRGEFRGHSITDYPPKLGDIIHNNQPGYHYDFAHARAHRQYASHSAIVVDFEIRNGTRHAVTIGGNESNTVGRKFVPLLSNGLIRQAANSKHYISVIENRMLTLAANATPALGRYVVSARPDLNLRAGPDTSFAIKQPLENGRTLSVLEFVDGPLGSWALVDLDGDGGRDGYVFASYITPAPV